MIEYLILNRDNILDLKLTDLLIEPVVGFILITLSKIKKIITNINYNNHFEYFNISNCNLNINIDTHMLPNLTYFNIKSEKIGSNFLDSVFENCTKLKYINVNITKYWGISNILKFDIKKIKSENVICINILLIINRYPNLTELGANNDFLTFSECKFKFVNFIVDAKYLEYLDVSSSTLRNRDFIRILKSYRRLKFIKCNNKNEEFMEIQDSKYFNKLSES